MRQVSSRCNVRAAGSSSLRGWAQKQGVDEHLSKWLEH